MDCNKSSGMTLIEVTIGIAILIIAMYFLTQLIYNVSSAQFEVRNKLKALLECEQVSEALIIYNGSNDYIDDYFNAHFLDTGVTLDTATNEDTALITLKKTFYTMDKHEPYNVSLSFIKFDPVE